MTARGTILVSPILCLTVLTVMAADNATHTRPIDAAPFHARAKAAVEAFPQVIGDWTGSDVPVPDAAVKLLHPNALVSRRYISHGNGGHEAISADLLISQCADPRDMTGHYPRNCYPSNGEPLLSTRTFRLKVDTLWIEGIEYQFVARPGQGIDRKSVYNFFVVPDCGIMADIGAVLAAASDHDRRCFGVAQFQVIMDADLSTEVRDEVFATLVGADVPLIKTLTQVK